MNTEHKSNTPSVIKDLIERVNELFEYNPETGLFIRKIRVANQLVGYEAGNVDKSKSHNYRRITIDRVQHYAHRLAWLVCYGDFPEGIIDHIDGCQSNNAISNLREVSNQENSRNSKLNKSNKSGFCGVHYSKVLQKWLASITVCGSTVHIGVYSKKEDAIAARISKNEDFGFHNNHGKK